MKKQCIMNKQVMREKIRLASKLQFWQQVANQKTVNLLRKLSTKMNAGI